MEKLTDAKKTATIKQVIVLEVDLKEEEEEVKVEEAEVKEEEEVNLKKEEVEEEAVGMKGQREAKKMMMAEWRKEEK